VARAAATSAEHSHDEHGSHAGHAHTIKEDADTKRLSIALGLIVAFMIGEVVAGILGHSLALLSDAAHMLTDAAALVMSLVVIRLVKRPAGGNLTFGLRRTEILSGRPWAFLRIALPHARPILARADASPGPHGAEQSVMPEHGGKRGYLPACVVPKCVSTLGLARV
jgi:hypothetical protein